MTISGLTNVTPGEYFIGIKGNNGTDIQTRVKSLKVYNTNFQNVNLLSPSNGFTGLSTTINLQWDSQVNAENYNVQVSTTPDFNNIVNNTTVTTNNFIINGLSQ